MMHSIHKLILPCFNRVKAEGKALLRGVVHMWSLDAPNNAHISASALAETQRLTIGSALFLVQGLAAFNDECKNEYHSGPPRLWIITSGAQPVIKGQEIEIAQGAIWGFGKTVALELPHLWGGLIDLDSENPADDVDALVAEVKWPDGEDQIAYCRGTRYVARLSSYREKFVLRTQTSFRPDSAYLISGGLGGLGLEVARWMAVEGARRIILLGRTPMPPRSIWDQLPAGSLESSQVAAIRAIEALGTCVYEAAVDVSDEAQLVSFLETFAKQVGAPIRGVIHAAGIIEDQSLLLMNLEKLQTVLRPKVLGGWLLHEKLAELSLEFFVTFSSSASLWGSLGQANYAAANAFLDSLAYYRRAQGKAGLSINWGPWSEVGMSARANLKARLARFDIASLSPRQGLMLMGKLLFQSIAQIGVVAIEPQQLHALFPSESHFLDGLRSGDSLSKPINQPDRELTMQILQTEPEKRLALTILHLKTRIARVVRLNVEQIPDDRSLMELGFDSIMVMELIRCLEKDLKLILYPREIFEQPSIAAFARYLLVELDRMNSAAATGPDLQAPANTVGESPPIEPLPDQEFFPLSYSQQRLLFAEQFDPGTPTYNIPVVLRLQGRLDHPALEKSLEKILQRHEALRTSFEFREGEWRPAIQSVPSVLMSTVDLQSISDPEVRKLEAHKLVTQEVCRPFNLSVGPMLRPVLFKLAPAEHILTLTVHHIACDGWSIGVLLNELAVLYSAALLGEREALPALPIQYGDYAAWQQKWLRSDLLESQLAFWKEQLGEPITPVLELPADHPHPAIQSYQGEQHLFSLSPTLLDHLKALSQQEGATLFMTLLAAFYVLLRRYTGQEDLLVGVPISGRNRPEIAPLIGFFVNNLVFRANLAGNPTFREFLAQVKRTALDAYAHQDIPFERLVEELHLERSLSHSPLFQVMFALQNSPMPHLDLPGLTLTHIEDIHTHSSKFDLFLSLTELHGGLTAIAEYSTELFNSGTVERLMISYHALLESIVADPALTVSELNILDSDQTRHILVDWNATEMDYPRDQCIHQLFEAQVRRTPEVVAVEFDGHWLTYAELDRRANQLAHFLQKLGVGPGTLVGISVERSLEMVIGLLGILKAGGAYVPMDPTYPSERLQFILADTHAQVVITQEASAEFFGSNSAQAICLDSDWQNIAQESEDCPTVVVTSTHPAYIIHTSGSTGTPKGVQVPHRAVVNFLHTMAREPGLTAEDILLAVTTLSFDIAGLELFLPLTQGARVVIASRATAGNGEQLSQALQTSRATIMQATPTTWQTLLNVGWQGSPDLKILCGGEVLSRELADRLLPRCASLWNLYGPTETTIWSSMYQVHADFRPVPIGRPIGNTQCYVLDDQTHIVPVGVVGELYISGDGLADGYLKSTSTDSGKVSPQYPHQETWVSVVSYW